MHMAPQKYEETASLKIFVDRGQESQFEKGAFAQLLPWILKESLYRRVRMKALPNGSIRGRQSKSCDAVASDIHLQMCRKICGLGCVTRALMRP